MPVPPVRARRNSNRRDPQYMTRKVNLVVFRLAQSATSDEALVKPTPIPW